jgi:hypothetical protein
MYDVEALRKDFPESRLKPQSPDNFNNPELFDLLRYGTQDELAAVILERTLPQPWRSLAIHKIPLQALIVAVFDRLPR